MRTAGSSDVLEYRRTLAVQRVFEGYSTQEVADFLGIDSSSVRRWLAAYRRLGAQVWRPSLHPVVCPNLP